MSEQVETIVEEKQAIQELQVKQDQLPQAQVSEASGLMSLVERMAIDPEIDQDRVERAFEMYKQVKAMDAESQFSAAMARAQSRMEPVRANMENEHTGKRYADLSAVHSKLKPIWTDEGFSFSAKPGESAKPGYVKVIVTLRHSAGHIERSDHDFPLDVVGSGGKTNKTEMQGMGSTFEYGRRYLELMMMDVSVMGKDNDGEPVQTISEDQAAALKDRLKETDSNVKAFLNYCGAKDVDSMSVKQYEKGVKMLDNKEKKSGASINKSK